MDTDARVKAVIFDMDGVLFDTEVLYRDLVDGYFREHGVSLTLDELNVTAGGSAVEFTQTFLENWGRVEPERRDTKDPLASFDDYCEKNMPSADALLNPGVRETLAELHRRGVACALASSSSMRDIAALVDGARIRGCFAHIVSGADFRESKPNPEIYLHTMGLLGLGPDDCLAVEDSDRGIAAAVAAGIRTVAKRDDRFGFTQAGATHYIDQIPEVLGLLA